MQLTNDSKYLKQYELTRHIKLQYILNECFDKSILSSFMVFIIILWGYCLHN